VFERSRIQSDSVQFVLFPRFHTGEIEVRATRMEQTVPVQRRRFNDIRERSIQLSGGEQFGSLGRSPVSFWRNHVRRTYYRRLG